MDPNICPKCGNRNSCGMVKGETECWCFQAKIGGSAGNDEVCLCKDCLEAKPLEENVFDENGALTREYLLQRGECCGNKCRNCPYSWINVPK